MTENYELWLSEERLALTSACLRSSTIFSFKALQFTLRWLSETPVIKLSELSLQPQLRTSRDFLISLSTATKNGEQVVWRPARLSQHGVTKHACCNTSIFFPAWEQINKQPWSPQHKQNMSKCQNKSWKGREDGEKPDSQTSLSVKLPQHNHAGSWEIAVECLVWIDLCFHLS